jgi:hypothetical protein
MPSRMGSRILVLAYFGWGLQGATRSVGTWPEKERLPVKGRIVTSRPSGVCSSSSGMKADEWLGQFACLSHWECGSGAWTKRFDKAKRETISIVTAAQNLFSMPHNITR